MGKTFLIRVVFVGCPFFGDTRNEIMQGDDSMKLGKRRNSLQIACLMVAMAVFFGCSAAQEEQSVLDPSHLEKAKSTKSCPQCALSGANFAGEDLRTANLSGANLRGANLSKANLMGANLTGANLKDANLSYAKLFNADLSGKASLRNANLFGADLRMAKMNDADLFNANLSGADLSNANLSGAYLLGTFLSDTIWTDGSKCKNGSISECVK